MYCNNKFCYWHCGGNCVHESEEGYLNAEPNKLNCESSLRSDFDKQRIILFSEIKELMKKLDQEEEAKIKIFLQENYGKQFNSLENCLPLLNYREAVKLRKVIKYEK